MNDKRLSISPTGFHGRGSGGARGVAVAKATLIYLLWLYGIIQDMADGLPEDFPVSFWAADCDVKSKTDPVHLFSGAPPTTLSPSEFMYEENVAIESLAELLPPVPAARLGHVRGNTLEGTSASPAVGDAMRLLSHNNTRAAVRALLRQQVDWETNVGAARIGYSVDYDRPWSQYVFSSGGGGMGSSGCHELGYLIRKAAVDMGRADRLKLVLVLTLPDCLRGDGQVIDANFLHTTFKQALMASDEQHYRDFRLHTFEGPESLDWPLWDEIVLAGSVTRNDAIKRDQALAQAALHCALNTLGVFSEAASVFCDDRRQIGKDTSLGPRRITVMGNCTARYDALLERRYLHEIGRRMLADRLVQGAAA